MNNWNEIAAGHKRGIDAIMAASFDAGGMSLSQQSKVQELLALYQDARRRQDEEATAESRVRGTESYVYNVGPDEIDAEFYKSVDTGKYRYFEGGAYRDVDMNKLDYEGFLSPAVIKRYAEYMHKNRKQSDGEFRKADNWQSGMSVDVYMASLWRHFMDVWSMHRNVGEWEPGDLEESLCAVIFNAMGYLYEELKDN